MKNKRRLQAGVITGVTLAHLGLIALAWQAAQLPEPIEVDNLTMVDLGGLGSAAPPPPLPVQPQPVLEKKPEVKPEPPKVKAVVRNNKPADIKAPPKEEPKKIEPPKQVTPVKNTEVNKTNTPSPNNVEASNDGKAGGQIGGKVGGQTDGKVGASGDGKSGTGGEGKGGVGHGDGGGAPSNQLVNGGYITRPAPKYPPLSEENGEEGKVEVRIVVEADGRISSAEVVKRSGYSRLDRAALNAVRAAQYQPHRKNGIAMRTAFTVGINFQLP